MGNLGEVERREFDRNEYLPTRAIGSQRAGLTIAVELRYLFPMMPIETRPTLPHLFTELPTHRAVALFALFIVAFLMSIGLFLIPVYQLVMFLLGHSTWGFTTSLGVALPLFLATVSVGYGLRWIFLMVMIAMNYWREYRKPIPLPDVWPFV